MKIKNIVIINDFDYIQGGASKVAIETANRLSKNKNQKIYFFSGDSKDSNDIEKDVIKISTNQGEALKNKNRISGFINGLYNIKARKELEKLLRDLEKDNTIIHIHGWTKCLSSSVFDIIFKYKFKLVITIHDYFSVCPNGGFFNYNLNEICEYKPLSYKCIKCNCDSRNYFFKLYRLVRMFIQNKILKVIKKIKYIVTISDLSESVLKKYFNSNAIIERINNPIDIDVNRCCANIVENNYVLYVGRLAKEKGIELFCECISMLDKKAIVVGDGPLFYDLKKKYKNIEFVGWKNSDEVKNYMKKARYLIFPSKWYEGAPLTPIEAMQYGIPCLISEDCSAREYIKNNNGFVFESNIDDLIKKMDLIEKNLVECGKESFNWVNKLEKENYINKLNKFYSRIMEEK